MKLLERQPTANELAMFAESSNFAVREYAKGLTEYANSHEYKTRYAEIQDSARGIFGYELDPGVVNGWIRADITDSELIYNWRNTPEYTRRFAGKPAWMSEKEYLGIYDKYAAEKDITKSDFGTYGGKLITEDDLRKIYYGGPGSEEIRKQYVEIQGRKAARESVSGKLINTTVTQTPFGPTQQLMRGISSAAGQGGSLPPTERFASYQDYKAGAENSKFNTPILADNTNMQPITNSDKAYK